MDRRAGRNEGSSGHSGPEETSVWERVVAALSALLVLGAVGFMLYEALAVPPGPPQVEVVADTVLETRGGYLVRVRAFNRGKTTAASLAVQGELKDASGTVESAEVVIDYVPAGATRAAGLIFSHDPRDYSLEIRARGFDLP